MNFLKIIFVVGVFPLRYGIFRPYPLLSPNPVLVVFYAVLLIAGGILLFSDRKAEVTAKHILLALLPCLLAGFFVANGALDHSNEIRLQTVVVETHYRYRWPGNEVRVRSWRLGRTTESYYERGYRGFYNRGDRVTLGIKSGALGMPWISSITRQR